MHPARQADNTLLLSRDEHHVEGCSLDSEVDSLATDFEREANALQDMVTGGVGFVRLLLRSFVRSCACLIV